MDTLKDVSSEGLTLATIILQNRERISILEAGQLTQDKKLDELAPLIKEIHADMVGRKAVLGVGGTLLKYAGWCIAGLGALFGVSQSNTALHWLSQFPSTGH